MPRVGFEPAIPTTKLSQTYALYLAAIEIGWLAFNKYIIRTSE
jgi:hypothetical protein